MKHTSSESSSNTVDQQHNNNYSKIQNEIPLNEPTELVEKLKIQDTPFTAVRLDDKWFLTMGKYRLTEPMKTFDEVNEDAHRADWTRVMQIIQIMIDENKTK